MEHQTLQRPAAGFTYPSSLGAPKNRHAQAAGSESALPVGTQVFSADNHISLSEDIFHERFPEALKDQAPRVFYAEDSWTLGFGDKNILPPAFTNVLMQYDSMPG